MKRRVSGVAAEAPADARVRLDKWLWAARFYRTRSLAAQAIDAGQVRVAGERVKPAHLVRSATRVSVRKQELAWHVDVLATSERRGSASDAAALYRETPDSVATREKIVLERKSAREHTVQTPGRPTKRDRRKLEDFLNEP